MRIKSQIVVLAAAAALLVAPLAQAQVTLTDIGPTAPTPGPYDQAQTVGVAYNVTSIAYNLQENKFPSQTFTTGNNASGYALNSVAMQVVSGIQNYGTGNWKYDLWLYTITDAGLLGSMVTNLVATSNIGTNGHWVQWNGITGVSLLPNTLYAYTFTVDAANSADGRAELSCENGDLYTAGQVCLISMPQQNWGYTLGLLNPITYDGTGGPSGGPVSATFDVGLTLASNCVATRPTCSQAAPIFVGSSITLTETAVLGTGTPTYYWLTDNGTFNPANGSATWSPVGGNSSTLAVNTTGLTLGLYQYQVIVSNTYGSSTSAVLSLSFVPTSQPGLSDIGFFPPTPGANDIYMTNGPLYNGTASTIVANSYYDKASAANGESFTTGSNPGGYVMNSVALETVNGALTGFTVPVYFYLNLYKLSGTGFTTATPIVTNVGVCYIEIGDWIKWTGLNQFLQPNSVYAYTFYIDTAKNGNSSFNQQKLSAGLGGFTGGSICQIPQAGGAVVYGSPQTTSASFDIGLSLPTLPTPSVPTYTPNVNPLYGGTAVTLTELSGGPPTMYYEWQTDSGTGGATWTTIGGFTTNTTLAVSAATTSGFSGAYEYQVIVTNTSSGMATSAPVTLNFYPPSQPLLNTDITPQPNNYAYVGQSGVTYSATFVGTLPITYQWTVDTGSGPTNIPSSSNPSATNNTLVLSNVQLTDAGTYYLYAYNSVGGATPSSSSGSTLVVMADPAAPVAASYAAAVMANDPVAFWPLDDTNNPSSGVAPAYDASGNNYDGTYGTWSENGYNAMASDVTNTFGPESPAFPGFPSVNYALYCGLNPSFPSYATVPPINLPGNSMTITAWINIPAALVNGENNAGILMYDLGSDAAGLCLGKILSNGMYNLGYTWNQNSSSTFAWDSGLFPTVGQWQFVAMVIDPSFTTLYLNTSSATNALANNIEEFGVGGTTKIGGSSGFPNFTGSIADVAVFNTELSGSQLASLYDAGLGIVVTPSVTLYIAPAGAGQETLTWSQGTLLQATNVSGPWTTNTAPSPCTIMPTNSQMYFKVLVN